MRVKTAHILSPIGPVADFDFAISHPRFFAANSVAEIPDAVDDVVAIGGDLGCVEAGGPLPLALSLGHCDSVLSLRPVD